MKNKELIKVLRYCGQGAKGTGCYNCPIYQEPTEKCFEIMTDAADALEELQQIADHYEQTTKDYWKEACEYKQRIAELEAKMDGRVNKNSRTEGVLTGMDNVPTGIHTENGRRGAER